VRQRDVVEQDIEPCGADGQVFANESSDALSLGDELRGIELGDDGFEDFVDNGRKDTLVVVGAKSAVDLW
jgi:hypothetical protein